jgi:hypothetical protein
MYQNAAMLAGFLLIDGAIGPAGSSGWRGTRAELSGRGC